MRLRPTGRLRSALAAVVLAAAPALAAPALSAGAQVYDLAVSGIPIGAVTISSAVSGESYEATGTIVPNAFIGALTSYRFDGVARGRLTRDGRVVPVRFSANSSSPRATRRTEIEWRGETPVKVSVEPPRKFAPNPAKVVGALDPVSTAFALLRDNSADAICDVAVYMFDGSRRSRLSLAAPAKAADGTYSCAGTYSQLEGEKHDFSTEAEYPFTLIFAPRGGGMLTLERIETRTRFGPAVVTRRG